MNIKNFGFKRHENDVVSDSVMVEELKGEHNNPIRIYKPEVLRNFCTPCFPKTLLYWFYKQNFKWSYIKSMFLPYVYWFHTWYWFKLITCIVPDNHDRGNHLMSLCIHMYSIMQSTSAMYMCICTYIYIYTCRSACSMVLVKHY